MRPPEVFITGGLVSSSRIEKGRPQRRRVNEALRNLLTEESPVSLPTLKTRTPNQLTSADETRHAPEAKKVYKLRLSSSELSVLKGIGEGKKPHLIAKELAITPEQVVLILEACREKGKRTSNTSVNTLGILQIAVRRNLLRIDYPPIHLTALDINILTHHKEGKSPQQIAKVLGRQPVFVERILKRLGNDLGATNQEHLRGMTITILADKRLRPSHRNAKPAQKVA